ncbi:MAG: AGE family epimerase/isomerase [Verrucomicrobiota bacterium]
MPRLVLEFCILPFALNPVPKSATTTPMHFLRIACLLGCLCLSRPAPGQDFARIAADYRPRIESNLFNNIAGFWYPKTLDTTNGGYWIDADIQGRLQGPGNKMIVTQARMVWLYSRLARYGYRPKEMLQAADLGYRFLRDKMWDSTNGGFYWMVDATGNRVIRPGKHIYGQSFALYALSEYSLAGTNTEALQLAGKLFDLIESKAHDAQFGGYIESFSQNWTPQLPGEKTYMGDAEFKLMNTHLHLLESVTAFYRATRLPLARERLRELIDIESNTVVRKGPVACTDKYRRNWEPVLTGDFARVSYGHDLENIWLLIDACNAAGIPNTLFLDLYRALFQYSLQYGFDEKNGGFYYYGGFNQPASNREKNWWVQAEACASALYMYRLTRDPLYLRVFQKTYDWIDTRQVDWKNGEWFETITPDGAPYGDKAQIWKAGYHNGRAMIECLAVLRNE